MKNNIQLFNWKKLQKYRLEVLKLSQERTARLLDCPTNTYRNWEKGRTVPSLEYYLRVKDLFKL